MAIQKRRQQNQINSFDWDGKTVYNPSEINEAIFQQFKEFYNDNRGSTPFSLSSLNWYELTKEEVDKLERPFSKEEIWVALRECDSSKAPGPDGFNAGWLKNMWPLISGKVLEIFQKFHNSSHIPVGANSSFVILIPKKL